MKEDKGTAFDEDLLELAITVELSMAELYLLYAEIFGEDREFWNELMIEEMNHASILKAGRQFMEIGKFPRELLPDHVKTIKTILEQLIENMDRFRRERPGKKDAYNFAIMLEKSAYENHYQLAMTSGGSSSLMQTFRKLNRADVDHARRIEELLAS